MSTIDTLRTELPAAQPTATRTSSVTDAATLRTALMNADITIPQLLRQRAAMHRDTLALREKE